MRYKLSTQLHTRNHVLQLANRGLDMHDWYDRAKWEIESVCQLEGWQANQFIDILAILSPRVTIRRNIRSAFVYFGQEHRMLRNALPNVITCLEKYLENGIIGGRKVPFFARALHGDQSSITLDTWMSYALLDVESPHIKYFRRKRSFDSACKLVSDVGDIVGLSPRDCQAAIWCGIFRESGQEPQYFPIMREYENWIGQDRHFPLSGKIADDVEPDEYSMDDILEELQAVPF